LLRKVIRKAKAKYYEGLIMTASNKTKESWKIINRENGKESKKKPSYSDLREGNVTIGNQNVAKAFNAYFFSSVNKLVGQSTNNVCFLPLVCEYPTDRKSEIVNIPITEAEVANTINSLKNKTSSEYDGLSNKIIKLCGEQIAKPLTYIYNLSVSSGICPDRLKYANIIPCFKKGDVTEIANYRPISLLTGFTKLLKY
jgi:hypothetical protein